MTCVPACPIEAHATCRGQSRDADNTCEACPSSSASGIIEAHGFYLHGIPPELHGHQEASSLCLLSSWSLRGSDHHWQGTHTCPPAARACNTMTLVSPGCVRLFNSVTNTERNCLKEDRSVFSHGVSSFSPGSPLPFSLGLW